MLPDHAACGGSRPTVGSSRKSTCGRCSIDWAISRRRIIPPENVSHQFLRGISQPHELQGFLNARLALFWRNIIKLGENQQIFIPGQCPIRGEQLRHIANHARTARRVTDDIVAGNLARVPKWGATARFSILMTVLFPAPFGPSKPKISPCGTAMVNSSTAINSPKILWSICRFRVHHEFSLFRPPRIGSPCNIRMAVPMARRPLGESAASRSPSAHARWHRSSPASPVRVRSTRR